MISAPDLELLESLAPDGVALLGVPWDEKSSFLPGAALAPPRIREALRSDAGNPWSELGVEIASGERLQVLGDLRLDRDEPVLEQIEAAAAEVLTRGRRLFALGGDHAVTYPLLRAHARFHRSLTVLHFDAHPDLYDHLDGDRFSHACPFARVMEEGLADRLVQVGIRTLEPHQRRQAERFGVEIVEMRHLGTADEPEISLVGPLYLSFDLDVLDPAFAPGVSHHEPGGMSTRQAIAWIHRLHAAGVQLVGADLVELNPHRDPSGVTATTAAKLVREIAAVMLS